MANQFYDSDSGVNWGNIADAAIGAGVGSLATGGLGAVLGAANNFIGGSISNLFNKKSEKRAMENLAARMALEYQYAQRYAENSPTWTVSGLRKAGINPMVPFMRGVPSSPSVSGTAINPSHTDARSENRFDPLTLANLGVANAQREMYEKQGNAADLTSKASMLNAETNARKSSFENMLKEAEIALKTLEKERFETGGNADSPRIRDARRTLDSMFRSFSDGWDYFKDSFASPSSALSHSPKSVKSVDKSASDIARFLDIMFGNPYTNKHGILPFRGIRRAVDRSIRKMPLFFNR